MRYARIENSIVQEIIDVSENRLEDMFHSNIVDQCVACDNTIVQGMLYNGVSIVEAPNPVITWDDVRTKRNTLISTTDWRVLPDQPVSQPWMDYRQALRDVTNVATPDLVVWPVEPV